MPNLSSLTPAESRRIKEFLAALRHPCKTRVAEGSSLVGPKFEEEFRSKLLAQHVFMGSPLFQEAFDAAFFSACRVAGYTVTPAPDGHRFWDVEVNGKKLSLKSSKAKNLSQTTLHISKLCEAAWIQDCRTARKRHDLTHELFEEYCACVHSIFMLRYFAAEARYELVEIPVSLFSQVLEVSPDHFAADGPTINIPIGKEPPDFTLKLDRSDAKITIANIQKGLCTLHAEWVL
jgi:hypothetical protein